jgi:hypothetical protein
MLKLVKPRHVKLDPSQLLGIILKIVLDERISDEELKLICALYRDTVIEWYS